MQRHQRTGGAGGSVISLLEENVVHIRIARAACEEIKLSRGCGDDRVPLEAPVSCGRDGVERERLVRGRRALVDVEVQLRPVRAVQGDRAADREVSGGCLRPEDGLPSWRNG